MTWQPIETAPRDGTMVLLWHRNADGATAGWMLGWFDQFHEWENMCGGLLEPTHWMPLPDPPQIEAKAA